MTDRRYDRAYHQCVDGMWADPDLTGDLLLIGLYWARQLHLNDVAETISGAATVKAVYGRDGNRSHRYQSTLRQDIRRYASTADPRNNRYDTGCVAPMVRREGLCGQSGNADRQIRDLDTGERLVLRHCARHRAWAFQQLSANADAWDALGYRKPVPPANAGGVLRRHLPEVDWPSLWRSIDENWVEPPEREPFHPPELQVLVTLDVEPVVRPRPALRLVPS
jgi:hypothetical protein